VAISFTSGLLAGDNLVAAIKALILLVNIL